MKATLNRILHALTRRRRTRWRGRRAWPEVPSWSTLERRHLHSRYPE